MSANNHSTVQSNEILLSYIQLDLSCDSENIRNYNFTILWLGYLQILEVKASFRYLFMINWSRQSWIHLTFETLFPLSTFITCFSGGLSPFQVFTRTAAWRCALLVPLPPKVRQPLAYKNIGPSFSESFISAFLLATTLKAGGCQRYLYSSWASMHHGHTMPAKSSWALNSSPQQKPTKALQKDLWELLMHTESLLVFQSVYVGINKGFILF